MEKYKNLRIAVTDAEYKHSLGIVRALGKLGISPYVITFNRFSLCGMSKYSNNEIILNDNYTFEELVEKLKIFKIELLILVGTNSFKKIVPRKDELKKNKIEIITVDNDIITITFDKSSTYTLAEKLLVPIPKTIYPKCFDELDILKNEINYPCVIKGLYEVGGNIVDYVYNEAELLIKYKNLCNRYNIKESDGLPMLQEYITGAGCAFFAVYDNGQCGLTFQHKRIREYPASGGASVCAESFKNDLVEKYGRILLDHLEWHGVAMVEFKLNDSGIPILMEINPKFWGSTDLALEANVNFPKALIDIYLRKKISYDNNYKYPLKYHWPLDGDFLHAIENPKSIINVLKDSFNPKVKSNIWMSDFFPTFKLVYGFIKLVLIKRLFRR
ncbi:ATP-grasp domain-containing protein [Xenorhabdus budapestensis]|uniref:ATP-grasp domain-containing protein n=1 Tax=Xenorhabdus budapestensis TaxID=290110 RepID=A0A2D0IWD1_XENBU|nr:ATP-grasp domain-containing protein [Xenorhabdus budapestensis]PHM26221.1 hypothetical protein Xbud_02689 [Xenorhabdus budapestensis]